MSEPACTESVLAVGAYNAEYQSVGGTWVGGNWASFSSRGPTLDERLKPEISAPGVNVASSINSYTDQAFTPVATVPFMGNDYPFARLSGTSMATPAVTGAAALLLEAAPLATPADIKAVIMATARTDSRTGVIPPQGSPQWGMGKLNVYRAMVELLGVVSVPEADAGNVLIWPNPATDVLYALAAEATSPMRYSLVDFAGRTIEEGTAKGPLLMIDLHTRASGVYTVRISAGDVRSVHRIVHY